MNSARRPAPGAKQEKEAWRSLNHVLPGAGRWALGAALLLLTACSGLHLSDLLHEPAEEPDLIAYAAALTRMDGEQRAQALAVIRENWRETNDARDQARLGLAYGQWGHAEYDPAAGARNIRSALAAESASWRSGERDFLEARAAELDYLAERENELASAHRETARLRENLVEAERKLRAITAIERSLDDRNGPR